MIESVFAIDPASGVPVYRQLVDQIKRSIIAGILTAGERLPSVKSLSVELSLNPNTIARVFRDLEKDGFIELEHGRGTFVANIPLQRLTVVARDLAETILGDALREIRALALSREDVAETFGRSLEKWYPTEDNA